MSEDEHGGLALARSATSKTTPPPDRLTLEPGDDGQNMVEFIALPPLLDTDDDENDDAEGAEGADSTAEHVHELCDEAPMCHHTSMALTSESARSAAKL